MANASFKLAFFVVLLVFVIGESMMNGVEGRSVQQVCDTPMCPPPLCNCATGRCICPKGFQHDSLVEGSPSSNKR
ncbi:hypothetical protein LINPERPRIM_LOCUS23595 [Linum perenne]